VLSLLPLLISVTVPSTTRAPAISRMQPALTACATLAKSDVEGAVGGSVAKGIESESGTTCDYAGKSGRVTITVQRLPAGFDFAAEIGALKSAMPSADIRFVPGLGVRAVFVDLHRAGAQLHVITQRDAYVLVSVLGFGDARSVSTAVETLARRVLGVI
jgi:hypothetical protein